MTTESFNPRRGRACISEEARKAAPLDVAAAFAGGLVLHAEFYPGSMVYAYVLLHPLFDEADQCAMAPDYEAVFDSRPPLGHDLRPLPGRVATFVGWNKVGDPQDALHLPDPDPSPSSRPPRATTPPICNVCRLTAPK